MSKNCSVINKEHEFVNQVLRWYVNQSLCAQGQVRVEQHIKECVTCRSDLHTEEKIQGIIHNSDTESSIPYDLSAMMKKIEDYEQSRQVSVSWKRRLPYLIRQGWRALGERPRTIRWVFFGQLLAIVTLFLVIFWYKHDPREINDEFVTLSKPNILPISDRNLLRIVFDQMTRLNYIGQLLGRYDATTLSGPTRAGVYTVEFNRTDQSSNFNEAIASLRRQDHVLFVEPVGQRFEE
jgi:hypothetical protein